jgi:hypothetical protein
MIRQLLVRSLVFAALVGSTGCAAKSALGTNTVDVIRSGESRSGRLSARDRVLADGSHFQDWIYEGRAGESIRLDMRSAEFDAYLQLRDATGSEVLARDDDGGSGTNARIEITLPTTGRYLIRANSFSADDIGAYTLSVTPIDRPTAGNGSASRVITAGETRTGRLTSSSQELADGSFYDGWYYDGRAGERIRIEMRSSDFDSYLSFGTATNGHFESLATNDDGAGGLDARIDITLPHTGRYLIRANTLRGGATGEYRLSVVGR